MHTWKRTVPWHFCREKWNFFFSSHIFQFSQEKSHRERACVCVRPNSKNDFVGTSIHWLCGFFGRSQMNFLPKLPIIICDVFFCYKTACTHIAPKCMISPSCDEALIYANVFHVCDCVSVHNQHQFAAHDPCPKIYSHVGSQLLSYFYHDNTKQ